MTTYSLSNAEVVEMIKKDDAWVVEENECIYGEYGEMVDKKPGFHTGKNTGVV
jgi:hypothetical protein